ncbi:pyruvate kinase [Limibacterium fermenti]|uniref:pyruvate kinase n=1 Tax=Limibacterium fermenti TaxID=3229863 RepID=UPI000E848141|nr:pyruvate kinase [Porphyromonadaceae bacterium]HBX45014.1 pyruvate kinase [Porphyromonadaceae bacterium]
MFKQTKIVATISDKRCDVPFVKQLFEEGMDVVRLNSAHLDEEGFLKIVNNVRAVSNRIALLVDTKGPEIRTTIAEKPIELTTGQLIKIIGDPDGISNQEVICVSYKGIAQEMKEGEDLLIDDGEVDLKVKEVHPDYLLCVVQNDGVVGSRKSVNVPGVRINLPTITPRDRKFIELAVKHDLDFIAHSFVRSKEDILEVQSILDEYKSPIKIIAKIENQEGVDNADEILDAAYGIMVARGDLGIEVAQEKIPGIQRVLIRLAIHHKKPVIVATQMLHSMIENPRPTRAEITDIANAIYYRTDAIMLSGETAYGKYPVEAVRTMRKVSYEAEKTKLRENDIPVPYDEDDDKEVTTFMAKQAVKSISRLNTKAIVTDSHTGRTARVLAAFRGRRPVFAIATTERLARELALSYGVTAEHQPGRGIDNTKESRRAYYIYAIKKLMDEGLLLPEDRVAYLGGSFGETGGTTYLDICEVEKILEAKDKYNLPDFTL